VACFTNIGWLQVCLLPVRILLFVSAAAQRSGDCVGFSWELEFRAERGTCSGEGPDLLQGHHIADMSNLLSSGPFSERYGSARFCCLPGEEYCVRGSLWKPSGVTMIGQRVLDHGVSGCDAAAASLCELSFAML
jgi:hypothetical protein